MTTAEIPVAELRERARTIRPGDTLATAVLWVIAAIGWCIGAAWRLVVFLALLAWYKVLVLGALSLRWGYWKGLGLTEEQIAERAKPPGK